MKKKCFNKEKIKFFIKIMCIIYSLIGGVFLIRPDLWAEAKTEPGFIVICMNIMCIVVGVMITLGESI